MTLTIHTEEDSQRQLQVTVEVPEERVQAQMRRTARALSKQVRIPGFRRGKVPYNILLQRVGEEGLRADAIEEMLESLLEETLDEIETAPYRQPTLDDIDLKPLVLKLTIPLEPTVVLGDYRAIRKEIEPVEVAEGALDEALSRIQSRHQILEDVDRPVEVGDLVTLSGEAKMVEGQDEIFWQESSTELIMDSTKTFPEVPFVDNIVGMSAGEEAQFKLTFPGEYEDEDLAGKVASFEVSVERVQSRELPELNDELAQQEGEYETVEELKEALGQELQKQAEQNAKSELLDEVVDEMLADAKIIFPPAAVETELDETLESVKDRVTGSGWKWEDYLTLQGETEESLREEWRESATDRVRRRLLLQQFILEERLQVKSSEIDTEVDERLKQYDDNQELRDQLRNIFTQGQGLQLVSNEILMEKVYDRVTAIVTGNAPDLEELEAEAMASDAAISEEE